MKRLTLLFLLGTVCSFVFGQKLNPPSLDSTEMVYINQIYLTGNKITRDKIIYRELTLKAGDSLPYKEFLKALVKSKENLNNSSLFNFVEVRDVQVVAIEKRHANIHIDLNERWYIWPMPLFEIAERNPNAWWETKDFSKINYGLFFSWENFRGSKEALKITAQGGYDEKLGFHYDIPFINKKQTLGLVLGAGLIRNHEITYQTLNNKPIRYRDDEYMRNMYYAYLGLNIRKNIYVSHYFQLEYRDHQYNDIVFDLNPEFDPQQNRKFKYFSLTYFYKNDHRNDRNFPLKGHYFDAIFVKRGLGFSKNTNIDLFSVITNLRKYWDLGNKFYFSAGFTGRLASTGKNPYFLNTGLGYNTDFVRGYEHYVVDGQDFGLMKTELKYGLIQNNISNISLLPKAFRKVPWSIYLSFFADAAYSTTELTQNTNSLQNETLFGYGAGINFVTYYDLVFRFEYSINRMKEGGLFISFMSAI